MGATVPRRSIIVAGARLPGLIPIRRRAVLANAVCIAAAGASLLASSGPATAATTWLGGIGNWTDATKWSNGAPTGGPGVDVALIDGGNSGVASTVTLNTATGFRPDLQSTTIDAGDKLQLNSTGSLTIEQTLTVNGTFDLSAFQPTFPNNLIALEFPALGGQINGNGDITFGNNTNTNLTIQNSTGLNGPTFGLTIGPGVLIHGRSGRITTLNTYPGIGIVNQGKIDADVAGGALQIGGHIENQGMLRAEAGGSLQLYSPNSSYPAVLTGNGSIAIDHGSSLVVSGWATATNGVNLPTGTLAGNDGGNGTGVLAANVIIGDTLQTSAGHGSLNITGNLTLTGGAHLAVGIDHTFAANTQLTVQGGNLDLSSSNDFLDLSLVNFTNPGDTYLIVSYDGTLTGTFDHVTPDWVVSYATPGKILATSLTPEPAAMTVVALASLAVAGRRGRKRPHDRTRASANRK
jgi:hypothetical protein